MAQGCDPTGSDDTDYGGEEEGSVFWADKAAVERRRQEPWYWHKHFIWVLRERESPLPRPYHSPSSNQCRADMSVWYHTGKNNFGSFKRKPISFFDIYSDMGKMNVARTLLLVGPVDNRKTLNQFIFCFFLCDFRLICVILIAVWLWRLTLVLMFSWRFDDSYCSQIVFFYHAAVSEV